MSRVSANTGRTSEGRVYYIGIDPGVNGGIAVLGGSGWVEAIPMPSERGEVWDYLSKHIRPGLIGVRETIRYHCVIEKVGGYMPGSKGNIGSRMFTFGESYGGLLMALEIAHKEWGLRYTEVAPVTWQSKMNVEHRRKDESKPQFKKRLRRIAEALFPKEKVTDKTADALILAEYCKCTVEGLL